VILRWLRLPETDWDYGTSVEKARGLGLAPGSGLDGETISRGTVAVIVSRGLEYDDAGTAQEPTTSQTLPDEPARSDSAQTTPTLSIDEMKAEIVRLTNEERIRVGLPALEVLPELMDCAQTKAQDMVDTGYVQHYSPRYGKANEMIRSFVPNATTTAENTTFGLASVPQDVLQFWMDSEGHRDNIMNERITHIGIGVAKWEDGPNAGRYAWVQQFVKL
jgi:uncharacterized protein YkwD